MAKGLGLKKEMALGASLLLVGFVGLPLAIYGVGQRVFGEYAPDQGVIDLIVAIWVELARLNAAAWLLVLSPYLVILLVRLAYAVWRPRRRAGEAPANEAGGLR